MVAIIFYLLIPYGKDIVQKATDTWYSGGCTMKRYFAIVEKDLTDLCAIFHSGLE